MDTPEIHSHLTEFIRENADTEIRKEPHDFAAAPIDALGGPGGGGIGNWRITMHRLTLETRQTSFDVWAALADPVRLFTGTDRLAPRNRIEQLCGEPLAAAGNEYRLTCLDVNHREKINGFIQREAGLNFGLEPRRADFRVARAGPWGGETAELVIDTLRNHPRAGSASLWAVAHPNEPEGYLRVNLECCELSRAAWLPDAIAAPENYGILDWRTAFGNLAHFIGAEIAAPYRTEIIDADSLSRFPDALNDIMRFHHGLAGPVSLLSAETRNNS